MNDELLLNNYLLILKSTVEVYIHGTLESSNHNIRDILKKGLDETLEHQSNCYDRMVNNGWYKIENVKPNCINKTLDSINSKN